MYDKVFISYATEDYLYAEQLYNFLYDNNFTPWLDKKNLLPGQLWNHEIKKALREANYVILLLSDNSVKKRGYVQREFKLALTYFEEKLEDDIYLIPLKINKCDIPESLNSFQWIELDEKNTFQQIVTSLNVQQNKYLEWERKRINKNKSFEVTEIKDEFHYKNDKVNFKINCNTFQFVDKSNQSLNELNSYIEGQKMNHVLSSRGHFMEIGNMPIDAEYIFSEWFFDLNITNNFINNSIISLTEYYYSFSGGAHGSSGLRGANFHINPNFKIEIQSLFAYEDHTNILQYISDFCFEELRKTYNEGQILSENEIAEQTKDNLFWERSLDPNWDNFSNFLISKQSLDIIFNEYQVSSYAFGMQIVSIPLESILEKIESKGKIQKLMNLLQ